MIETNIIPQIAGRDADRLRGYTEFLDFYQGRQWPGRERWGEKRLTFNYARVFIEKLTSYLMTGAGFIVEPVDNSPPARAAAEAAGEALRRVYEFNGLEQLDYETEIDCAVLGDACYKVVWDPASREVRVTSPDIQGIFVWWRGDDISDIRRVASRYQLSEEEALELYGEQINRRCGLDESGGGISSSLNALAVTGPGGRGEVGKGSVPFFQASSLTPAGRNARSRTVVEVWTEKDFELYLEGTLIERKPNPCGFIPFVIFPNLRDPKKFWGVSDLVTLMEPQKELNRALSQVSHILELSGNPVAVLENVEESTDIAVRPGAVWNIPEDAKAYLLDLLQGGGLQLHINYIELLYRALHDLSEAPRAAFGGVGRDLSGVAMQIELYPLLQKVLRKRTIRTAVYNRRNRLILKLLRRFQKPDWDEGLCRLKTVWGQVLPQDRAQIIRSEETLIQNGIHSRKRAMNEMNVQDPEAEFKLWLEEERSIAEMRRFGPRD